MNPPVKIGVISDTHFDDVGRGMAFMHDLMQGPFRGIDVLLHAGDLVREEILDAVTDIPVHAVRGKLDPGSRSLSGRRILTIAGKKIALIHGWGPPHGLELRLYREFSQEALDVLVFGHTHRPLCHRHEGVLLFNPGSATDKRDASHHTVGLLEIGHEVVGRILRLD